jgi:hypothetical protein
MRVSSTCDIRSRRNNPASECPHSCAKGKRPTSPSRPTKLYMPMSFLCTETWRHSTPTVVCHRLMEGVVCVLLAGCTCGTSSRLGTRPRPAIFETAIPTHHVLAQKRPLIRDLHGAPVPSGRVSKDVRPDSARARSSDGAFLLRRCAAASSKASCCSLRGCG